MSECIRISKYGEFETVTHFQRGGKDEEKQIFHLLLWFFFSRRGTHSPI